MPPDGRLVDTAQSLLDNLADGLTEAGISLPARQYIHSGDIAQDLGADCDELFVVSWSGTTQGNLSGSGGFVGPGSSIKCSMPMTAQYTVLLTRCVPTLDDRGNAPSAAELQAAGEEVLADAMTLPAVTIDKHLAGELLSGDCRLLGINAISPIGPFGGVGGTNMTLLVELA